MRILAWRWAGGRVMAVFGVTVGRGAAAWARCVAVLSNVTAGWLRYAAVVAPVAAILMLAGPLRAQEGRREVEEGNRLYDEGRYQEAHARYLEALAKVPGLSLARFNEGNALYQSQEFQRAMEAYLEAAESGDPEWQSRAWYNLGNALMRQQQPGAAAEAYKQSLRRDPQDRDAKHNLELALRMLEEHEQQQGQDGQE
ncbi:MAG: tetratricopeptide repeat protein, partial [Gemmatimonadetes bacterium]|nr:tetratricopeptide repeat protein [Gemmatimonadota bacterium]MYE69407.1 tetratricopeptide repeat protein [Gemmatimonadota bacterium]